LSPILGIIASQNYVRTLPGSYDSIQTVTLSSSQSNITFTSIPSTYKHLQIRLIGKDTRSDSSIGNGMYVQFNSDTTSTYSWHYLYGAPAGGSSLAAGAGANATSMPTYTIATDSYNTNAYMFGAIIIDILDYANTNKYKTIRSLGGISNNGVGGESIFLGSGNWRSTTAVSSIKLFSDSFNLKQYTQAALYGIKG